MVHYEQWRQDYGELFEAVQRSFEPAEAQEQDPANAAG